MNIFHRRHLALFCAIFAATSICGCFLPYNNKLTVIFILTSLFTLLSLTTIVFKLHRHIIFKSALCVLFSLVSLFSQFVAIDTPINKIQNHIGHTSNVVAVVKSVNTSTDFLSLYTLNITSVNDTNVRLSAILEFDYDAELEVGEQITGNFITDKIESYSQTPSYYKANNVMLYLHSSDGFESEVGNEKVGVEIKNLNQILNRNITREIKGDADRLISALMLGNKDRLDDAIVRDFRRAGLSHVLAISGMHLSVLIFFFDFILKKLGVLKILRGGIVIPTALFYVALTGFSSSTVRAFVMTAIVYLAFVLQDDNDLLTTLFFALFVILAVSPYSVYDIGLWLSFLAVVGIFVAQYFINSLSDLLYTKLNREKRVDKYALKRKFSLLSPRKIKIIIYIFSSLVITFFANIFICVPVWLYFNEISLISLLTNLVATPLVTIILYLSPIFILTSSIPFFGGIFKNLLEFLCNLLLKFVSIVASVSGVTLSTKYSFTGIITIVVALVLTVCLVVKLKRKWIIFIPPIIAGLMFSFLVKFDTEYYKNITQLDYIGGKESEMLLLRSGNEYSIIDISTGGSSHAYNAYLLSIENCATDIDSFVLTHYHNYHVNGLKKLFKRTVVDKLYLPYPCNIDEYYVMSSVIASAVSENVDVVLFDADAKTEICNNVTIDISPRHYLKRSTHPTFYFTISSNNQNFTYFSESVFEALPVETLENTIAKSDFILLGAHGPITKEDVVLDNYSPNSSIIIADNKIKNRLIADKPYNTMLSDVVYLRVYLTER